MHNLSIQLFLVLAVAVVSRQSQEWHFTGVNIARNMPTEHGIGTYGSYGPDRAVDGRTSGKFNDGSCSHTNGNKAVNSRAYWKVFLARMYTIKGVRIYTRYGFMYRNENFKVVGNPGTTKFHDDANASPKLYNNRIINIPVSSSMMFSEITFEIPPHTGSPNNGQSIVTLCEVEVYSAMNDCNIISPAARRNWSINAGTGYTDPSETLVSSGSVIKISCSQNYTIEGQSSVTCLSNGSYNHIIPQCIEIRCSAPPTIANGEYREMDNDTYSVGSKLTWFCKSEYESEQKKDRTCLETATWSGDKPQCVLITCHVSPSIDHGTLKYINGSEVQVENIPNQESVAIYCNEGYQSNVANITCTLEGKWTDLPSCHQITCEDLKHLTGGYFVYNNSTDYRESYVYDTVAEVVCNETLYKSTKQKLVCGKEGEWKGNESTCIPLCEKPHLQNGIYQGPYASIGDNNYFELGEYVTPICNEGFKLDSDTDVQAHVTRTCTADHSWDGEILSCSRVECSIEALLLDDNYYELGQSTNPRSIKFNETLVTNCRTGYRHTSGDVNRTCLANKTFSGEELACTAIPAEGPAVQSSVAAAAGGGVAGAVVVCVGVAFAVFMLRRKRRRKDGKSQSMPTVIYDSISDTKAGYSNDLYQNSNEAASVSCNANETNDVYQNCVEAKSTDVAVDGEQYYNFSQINKISKTAIKVCDLAGVVFASDSASERFAKEFQTFPHGMTCLHTEALANKGKNRYRDLYAYDDTRVELAIWDEQSDGDYINACHIYGFNGSKAYIASQGPVKNILNDFWRMIWQTRCGKIVMLTNIYEEGKTVKNYPKKAYHNMARPNELVPMKKCERYWPKEGTEVYGSITVRLVETDTYSNFEIRTLTVEKAEEQRRVQHFHFTSWPDRDVPFFCSALVNFRQKVKSATSEMDGPVIVHCSAGIGRTGTFIAIDYVVDQAADMGYVDVVSCVETLRRQRVNMVQTEKQYVFIHQALVEILVMKTSAVHTSDFDTLYRDLVSVDPVKKQMKINQEYELLNGISPKIDEKRMVKTEDEKHRDKSRYSNVHPTKDYMPSLSQPGLFMFGEFINATFLPMYTDTNGLIITQTPLETTKEDFWLMVYHQDVHTIVMMNHISEIHANEIYWPGVEKKVCHGDMSIINKGAEKRRGHMVLELVLTKDSIKRQIKLIQFGEWNAEKVLPKAGDVLSAFDLVQDNQRHTGKHPVVVHCMDGLEKSGLFCVAAALLDRTRQEQDVAISQVIEEMRNRRENIIPNVEQFEFLHDVVLAFLQQFETYSNFTL